MEPRDELAIRNLIARVARLTDKWSSEQDYLENYTEDCIWHLAGTEPYHGHAGMGRRLREMLEAGICGPGLAMRHCITSLEVSGDESDPNVATAQAFVIMVSHRDGIPGVFAYGEMVDTVRRVDGRWKIAIRKGLAVTP